MSFKEFARKFIQIIENSGVDYVTVGGIAAIYYGEPRVTQDIDVILRLYPDEIEKIEKFVSLLKEHGFIVIGGKNAIIEALREKSYFTIFNENFFFRMDAQGVYSRLNELAFEGRSRVKIFGIETWLQGPEDLIVAKLAEYISNRDIKDVIAILQNSRDEINWKRLWRIAREFNVHQKLAEIIKMLGIKI